MGASQPTVVCFGETMGMFTPTSSVPLNTATGFTLGTGGAESNVAMHLAELGHAVAWASAVGTDPVGTKIIDALGAAGVDTRWVGRTADAPTGLYLKEPDTGSGAHVFYYRQGSAASTLKIADADGWPLAGARWIHTTGITPALSDSCSALVEHVLDHAADWGASVSFDINFRPGIWSVLDAAPRLLALAEKATVVLVGLDEAAVLWGCATAADVRALLPRLPYLVVKDSSIDATEFALAADGTDTVTVVPARKVDVVEPVGAGDAFAAGYLSSLLSAEPSAERLERGHSRAAWALGSRQDFRPGLGQRMSADEPSAPATHDRTFDLRREPA
ncbi:carbohydrate kinase [Cryobacterium sp. LW097]|uniref:sugar kinase n=1 Tax=unclassified Cryobacterium TaxID=2649013 RepID=UPI000B4CB31C|nr:MULTISPECIES: sugar kinase [unclassified Cryobacterium]ASD23243.1 carbohydrate kinase [Cryobacterium sp. LW097]TFC52746.1 sugar kinase [Cryobacterium sp. TMB3-1-2]TFC60214.1 sugar kinase [Cryobacterium sp. TMB1-7]TFC68307.1 sugar kinase [Cryobacterium sp. TMB3-15]TFC74992.1 sugar kinase [Cryobacterium sp. TMB3-10]